MVQDMRKLEKFLGYLKCTQEQTLLLCTPGTVSVIVYVDAAYAGDSKSHSGAVIYMEHMLVYI
jgi:hypothetical protein